PYICHERSHSFANRCDFELCLCVSMVNWIISVRAREADLRPLRIENSRAPHPPAVVNKPRRD
ncbi:MAG TPA: hypothetical protein VF064_03360, partial [Pyrinomonadaceae bacterium]